MPVSCPAKQAVVADCVLSSPHTDYRRTAKKQPAAGDRSAQSTLGTCYSTGEDVPRDVVKAYMWWSVCASGDDDGDIAREAEENRAWIADRMTAGEISKAEQMAATWSNDRLTVEEGRKDRLEDQEASEPSADDRKRLDVAMQLNDEAYTLFAKGEYEEARKLYLGDRFEL